jgi:transposase-like protein
VRCPHCQSAEIIKRERDESEPFRQRDECKTCGKRFDDLTNTAFAGHHQPLKTWVLFLYFLGLNPSTRQIAQESNLNENDAQRMAEVLRPGVVEMKPARSLSGEAECDEVYVVAGHKKASLRRSKKAPDGTTQSVKRRAGTRRAGKGKAAHCRHDRTPRQSGYPNAGER